MAATVCRKSTTREVLAAATVSRFSSAIDRYALCSFFRLASISTTAASTSPACQAAATSPVLHAGRVAVRSSWGGVMRRGAASGAPSASQPPSTASVVPVISRAVRGQECDRLGDLFRRREAAHRRARLDRRAVQRATTLEFGNELRSDVARRDRIDRMPQRAHSHAIARVIARMHAFAAP